MCAGKEQIPYALLWDYSTRHTTGHVWSQDAWYEPVVFASPPESPVVYAVTIPWWPGSKTEGKESYGNDSAAKGWKIDMFDHPLGCLFSDFPTIALASSRKLQIRDGSIFMFLWYLTIIAIQRLQIKILLLSQQPPRPEKCIIKNTLQSFVAYLLKLAEMHFLLQYQFPWLYCI